MRKLIVALLLAMFVTVGALTPLVSGFLAVSGPAVVYADGDQGPGEGCQGDETGDGGAH